MKYIKTGFIFVSIQVMFITSLDAAYYRWTDKDGKTHYSSTVPPEQVKRGHVELDKQGLKKDEVVSEKKRQKLLEIARIKKEKQEAKEAQEKIEAEKAKKQYEEDRLLLSIFNNEEEIIKSYETKLELSQSNLTQLERTLKTQSDKLMGLEDRYEKMKDSKHKDKLKKQIDVVVDDIEVYQKVVSQNLAEKVKLQSDYDDTLMRFRELLERKKK